MNWYKLIKQADQFTDFLSPEETQELNNMNDTIVLYQKSNEALRSRGQRSGLVGTEEQDIGNNKFMIEKVQQKIKAFKTWVLKNRGERQEHSVLKAAIDHYKTTEDPSEAGYIIPDGTMLDFSGGSMRGSRNVDHRAVSSLLGKPGLKMTEGMNAFMRLTGAVRIMYFFPTYMYVNFKTSVTQAQISRIISIGRDIEIITIEGPTSAHKELTQKLDKKISPHRIQSAINELV